MIRSVCFLAPSLLALTIVTPPLAVPASAAATPAQICQAGKNNVTGKYHYCRQKAEAKYATTSNSAARTAALQKCLDKYNAGWAAVEKKAGGACTNTGDASEYQNDVETDTTNIATGLAGGTLQDYPMEVATCQDGLSTCNADVATCETAPQARPLRTGQFLCWDSSGTQISCTGTGQDGDLQKGVAFSFRDNGDGTITDNNTGLMWEVLTNDGSIHDMGNKYTWDDAFAVKVAMLNSGGGFAGHTDWRVPNVKELQSILDYENLTPSVSPTFNHIAGQRAGVGCDPSVPCTDCTCTASGPYWTSTTWVQTPANAWDIDFSNGDHDAPRKSDGLFVRAVRGGS